MEINVCAFVLYYNGGLFEFVNVKATVMVCMAFGDLKLERPYI